MIPLLIVETNYFVQLVTDRGDPQQSEAARDLMRLAVDGAIRLAIPAFSLLETEFTLRMARKRRNALSGELLPQEAELRRSPLSRSAAQELGAFRASLVEIEQREGEAFFSILDSLLQVGKAIPLDSSVIRKALQNPYEHDLDLSDSVVFASVIDYLQTLGPPMAPRCFLNYNKNDFGKEAITGALAEFGCGLHFDARGALRPFAALHKRYRFSTLGAGGAAGTTGAATGAGAAGAREWVTSWAAMMVWITLVIWSAAPPAAPLPSLEMLTIFAWASALAMAGAIWGSISSWRRAR